MNEIHKELLWDEQIMDEINSIGVEIDRFKVIMTDILMMEYITRASEIGYVKEICKRNGIDYIDFIIDLKRNAIITSKGSYSEELNREFNFKKYKKTMNRLDKKRILFNLYKNHNYKKLIDELTQRADVTISAILEGVV